MHRQIKRSCLLLLALPLVAMATPVTVTTHATGWLTTDVGVLWALGMIAPGTPASEFPDEIEYVLTMRSTFDPGIPAPGSTRTVQDYSSDIVIDLLVGGEPYHYAGKELSQASTYTRSDTGELSYSYETYSYSSVGVAIGIDQSFFVPGGIPGSADPLAEREFSGVDGVLSIRAFSFPNWSSTAYGDISKFSVQVMEAPVTSPVPEPESWAMTSLALLALGLRHYKARKSLGQAA